MKASVLQTLWIIIISIFSMIVLTIRGIVQSYRGKATRKWVDKVSVAWAKKVLSYIELDYDYHNPHNVQFNTDEPTILILNHVSLYDIPLTIATIPATMRMIGKKELFRIPLFGKVMRLTEHIKIDRQNREQAVKDLAYAKEKLESGVTIWICPEGTRSRDGKLARFKKGGFLLALQTGARIIPVGIRGTHDILPAKTYQLSLKQKASVHIGKPIYTKDYTYDQKDELIERARREVAILTGQAN